MKICGDCFLDEELRSEVNANADADGVCEACGSSGKLMDFCEFQSFFEALLSLFSISSKSDKTIANIIQDEWHLFKEMAVATKLLSEAMAKFNPGYSINDKVDYTIDIQERVAVWDRLKTSVKENSRFFTNMDEFAKYNYLTAGKSLYAGQQLYRSRVTPVGQKKIKCEKMGCPPKELAIAGRANPVGIPYLYLSDSAKTTYFEVRAVYLDKLSVGTFRIERDLTLIDFVYDVNLFLSYNDGGVPLKEIVIKKKVIDAISADLSRPLRRYDSEIEYVPTQLICEYCKDIPGADGSTADGITFESSLHKGGRNYVLFDEAAAKCIRVESHEITRIDIDRK
ncbi:MAG: RES family NAD+ phosphorylase [Muribaculaceae bacterium]|nr:RES family NAD+ phosphorylase [Muribaculaceae bacterium]